ncbi:unnamed protein product [Dovyalis caffra]|uniref:Uncharacterized protein n=1 Tax=Dovyalis caffra TaxID=77055 RepID=A0AAV1S4B9_9ROSI|nr:unnamed protein product [Dovyalis caffra]
MDAFPGTSKATCHVRSISLPAESHPLAHSVKLQLGRLRSSQETSSSNCQRLSGLRSLYECVDDFLQLPLTCQALSSEQHQGTVDELLDRSLRLLDVCGATKDIFSQMKECLKDLESSMRRKRGESSLASDIEAYMISRKKLRQVISKCKSFRSLKTTEKCISVSQDKDTTLVTLTREVEEISVAVFASLLSSVSLRTKSKGSGSWSIVSKLLKSKTIVDANEIGTIDDELLALKSSKDIRLVQVQNVLKSLEASQSSIQELEDELEFAYRLLLKTRVSLLNILNH